MKIFKFGGVSLKSATAIKNVANILKDYQSEALIVVFSAKGKMANALKEVVFVGLKKNGLQEEKITLVEQYLLNIVDDLFVERQEWVVEELKRKFSLLKKIAAVPPENFHEYYDTIVPFGEALSTFINSEYLFTRGIRNSLTDVKSFVVTNDNFRDAAIILMLNEHIKLLPIDC